MAEKIEYQHEANSQESPSLKEAAGENAAGVFVDGHSNDGTPIRRHRYAFGAQGKTLMRTISACGAIGFLLFGYDQGVLGVCSAV